MFQIRIGVNSARREWIYSLKNMFCGFVRVNDGVTVISEEYDRTVLSVAADVNSKRAKKEVREILKSFYLFAVKQEYLYGYIKKYAQNEYLLNIYVHILKAFNTGEEESIINRELEICSNFALDGFYNFRLGTLRDKWNDLVELSMDNSDLLSEDNSFGMLLKYMLSCLPCKNESVSVDYENGEYTVKTDDFKTSIPNANEVVLLLVDLAPSKIFLSKSAEKTKINEKIMSIFDSSFV